MAEHLRLINGQKPKGIWDHLVMTDTSKEILRSVNHVRRLGDTMTMVAGRPGSGKSETLLRYTQNTPGTIMHTVTASEGKVWDIACALMKRLDLGRPNAKNLAEERERIADEMTDGRLLIIDEAQYLLYKNPRGGTFYDSFEWLRSMAENGFFSIVFAGDLELLNIVAKMPQFDRRITRRVVIKNVSKKDVTLIATDRNVTDPASLDALHVVAHLNGGHGTVVQVIRHAKDFAGGQTPSIEHILAAVEDLKLRTGGRLS